MAQNGHTAGEWLMRWDGESLVEIGVQDGKVWCPLASVFVGSTFANEDGDEQPDETCQDYANARLIAAAPDLLEACKDAAERAAERGDKPQLALLNAAIAKATD